MHVGDRRQRGNKPKHGTDRGFAIRSRCCARILISAGANRSDAKLGSTVPKSREAISNTTESDEHSTPTISNRRARLAKTRHHSNQLRWQLSVARARCKSERRRFSVKVRHNNETIQSRFASLHCSFERYWFFRWMGPLCACVRQAGTGRVSACVGNTSAARLSIVCAE